MLTVEMIEQLLQEMGSLYELLTEDDIDAILAASPPVTLSEQFRERALKGMREAQKKREERR